jgi:hypothetical protein
MSLFQPVIKDLRYKLRATKLRAPLVWFRHRGLASTDVFLASYQRSGSTWVRFLLCEILTKRVADFRNVKFTVPDVRHYREAPPLLGSGRLIKTHEPYRKEYKKALYIVRDPRDVALSLYEYDKPKQSLEEFVESFVRGKASPHGTWQRNVWSWLNSPLVESGDLLVIKYEDMRLRTEETLAAILEFLGSPEEPRTIQNAIANNDLRRMRVKEDRARAIGLEVSGESIRSKGRGVRNGSIGEWQRRLTDAQARLIEEHAGEFLARLGYPNPGRLDAQDQAMSASEFAEESSTRISEASA